MGTGHAMQCAMNQLADFSGTIVVTYADVPLLRPATLQGLVDAQHVRAYRGDRADFECCRPYRSMVGLFATGRVRLWPLWSRRMRMRKHWQSPR